MSRLSELDKSKRSARRYYLFVFTLTLTAVALFTFGCRQRSSGQAVASSGAPTIVRLITPISFGELNGDEDYNASGVVPLGDSRFLFCDNHVSDALYELDLTSDGQKQSGIVRRPLQGVESASIDDLEGMTMAQEGDRRFVFVASSLCLKKARKELEGKASRVPSNGLLRVKINPDHGLSAENMPGFRDWLIQQEPQLAVAATRVANDDGLNIEGLAWDSFRHALLFGARTPAPDGKPLVIPVKIKDLAGPWTTDNLEIMPSIHLTPDPADGSQGIRSLEYVEGLGSFLVVMGKTIDDSKAPFTLYEWDGKASGTMRRMPFTFAKKMRPEGVTAGTIGGKAVLLFVDDAGGFQSAPLETASH